MTVEASEKAGGCGTMRLLLVDDDPSILQVLRIGLRLEGYEVRTAGNGEEALNILKDEGADLVVLDLMMPVMDGRAFLREVRVGMGSRVPVVVLTAVDRRDVVDELKRIGASGVLHKPLEINDIAETLEQVRNGRSIL